MKVLNDNEIEMTIEEFDALPGRNIALSKEGEMKRANNRNEDMGAILICTKSKVIGDMERLTMEMRVAKFIK